MVPVTSRSVSSVNVQFPRSHGSTGTVGTVDLPGDVAELSPEEFRETGVPVAVFAHCFTCNRNVPAAFRVSKTLARNGIACLRLDFSSLLFSDNVAELRDTAAWLAERLAPPSLLVGHSLGGAAVLRAARHISSLTAVATIGAPARPASAARTLLQPLLAQDADLTMVEKAPVTVPLTGRKIELPAGFFSDLADWSDATTVEDDIFAISENPAELLVLHSPTDQTVPVGHTERIMASAGWPKSMLSLRDSDHLLTWRGSAARAGETIAGWFNAQSPTR